MNTSLPEFQNINTDNTNNNIQENPNTLNNSQNPSPKEGSHPNLSNTTYTLGTTKTPEKSLHPRKQYKHPTPSPQNSNSDQEDIEVVAPDNQEDTDTLPDLTNSPKKEKKQGKAAQIQLKTKQSSIMFINIIHHNVRHWVNPIHINELSNYYISQDPHIITINSHSITKPDKFVKLFGYSGYTRHKQISAGVAILIKYNIHHTFHTDTNNNNIMAATINTKHGKITIVTFYRPPRQDTLPLTDLIHFLNFNNTTIILADANIKHQNFGHNNSDRLGKLLKNFTLNTNLHLIGPDFNTYYQHNHSGKPDIILANTSFLQLAYNIKEGPRLTSSDHIPILITASTSPLAIPSPPDTIITEQTGLNLKSIWTSFLSLT